MDIVVDNISWMGFNILLAFVSVLFGWLLRRTTWKFLRMLYGIVWILFLPNTLYLLTDIIHFFEDIGYVRGISRVIVVAQYILLILLGIGTYFAAVYPIEKTFIMSIKSVKLLFVLIVNLLVGFGMTLGRVERVNSWDILYNISSVFQTSIRILTSTRSLLLVLFFTIIGIIIYILLRFMVKKVSFA